MQRVLLIEDNDEIRENTAEILELANYKVDTAANGKLGVEKALEFTPDLIICDVMMPVLDGYGVLHLMQKNETLKNVPFIFLTAKAERGDFRKGMEMGADDYITKPFSDIELLTAIESRLKKASLLQSNFEASLSQQIPDDVTNLKALQELVENSPVNFYKKKQLIYAEGNHPVRLFYIQKGKVKTYKTNDDGKELTVGLFGEGDYVGYTAILEGTVYKETTEAIEDTTLSIIAKEEFEKLLQSNKDVSQQFIHLLAQSVTDRERQLVGIAYNSLRKRVAEALVLLQKKYTKDEKGKFSIHISREDLAHIAGTATESIIRTLSDFKSEKLIDIKEGSIIILDEKRLAALLN
ncbi:MAG: Transcriptional regulator [Ferruginibacter sp.]|nr:Transcriptional regulator [Ferruginibacter sp.]